MRKYMTDAATFTKHLLVLAHITDGMPARAPEIRALTVCNTDTGLRCLYITHGISTLCFFFFFFFLISRRAKKKNLSDGLIEKHQRYHKSMAITAHESNVLRCV
jgi:hypothetical protein